MQQQVDGVLCVESLLDLVRVGGSGAVDSVAAFLATYLPSWGTSVVLHMAVAILALMIILRRQWAENERFGFPMLIFPRTLLEEEAGPDIPLG